MLVLRARFGGAIQDPRAQSHTQLGKRDTNDSLLSHHHKSAEYT